MEQLAEKRRKEVEDKAKAERVAKTHAEGAEEEDDRDFDMSQKLPSAQIDKEEPRSKQGGANPETTPFRVKCTREQEK